MKYYVSLVDSPEHAMSDCDFLSIKEFASKIGVHPDTIRRSIKSGRINGFKVGSGKRSIYRICKSEINRVALKDLEYYVERIIEKRLKGEEK